MQNPPQLRESRKGLASRVDAADIDAPILDAHTSVVGDDLDIEPCRGPEGCKGNTEEGKLGWMRQSKDLPRRRLGNWARGGIEADESGILLDMERRVSQVAQVEEVADSDRSPSGECSTRKCWRFETPIEVCTEKPHALRVAMCTGPSRQQQQQESGLTACNQRQVCP